MIPLIRVVVMGRAAVVEVAVVELILLLAVVAVVTFIVRLVRLMVGTEDWSRREELRL